MMVMWILAGITVGAACWLAREIRRNRALAKETERLYRIAAREVGELERLGPQLFFDVDADQRDERTL